MELTMGRVIVKSKEYKVYKPVEKDLDAYIRELDRKAIANTDSVQFEALDRPIEKVKTKNKVSIYAICFIIWFILSQFN